MAGGGQPKTVTQQATLLTQYGPVTIINISSDLIWVADSTSVGPGFGVPVEPGTSLKWESAGVVYAVLDTAATDTTAAVVLTNATDLWTPSPAAIGAEVALQLAQSGIPVTALSKFLYEALPALTGATCGTPGLDVTGFQSVVIDLLISGSQSVNVPTAVHLQWYDPGTGSTYTETIITVACGLGQRIIAPCRTNFLSVQFVQNNAANTVNISVSATTRTVDRIRIQYNPYSAGAQDNNQLIAGGVASIVIPAAGTGWFQTVPVEGQTNLTLLIPTVTSGNPIIEVLSGNRYQNVLAYDTPNNPYLKSYYYTIAAPQQSLQVTISNYGTASITTTVSAFRVPI